MKERRLEYKDVDVEKSVSKSYTRHWKEYEFAFNSRYIDDIGVFSVNVFRMNDKEWIDGSSWSYDLKGPKKFPILNNISDEYHAIVERAAKRFALASEKGYVLHEGL